MTMGSAEAARLLARVDVEPRGVLEERSPIVVEGESEVLST